MRKLLVFGLLAFVIGLGIDVGANLGQLLGILVGISLGYMVLSSKYRRKALQESEPNPPLRPIPPADVKLEKIIRSNNGKIEVSDNQVDEWLKNNPDLEVARR